jgi:reductive dehalogenase
VHETLERPTDTATRSADPATRNGSGRRHAVEELPVLPNYGRTVQVVGPVINVNTEQMPHPKNIRGELGKAAFNWYRNTVSKDPLTRVTSNSHCADKRNYLTSVLGDSVKGKINPRRVEVEDPAAMARHIKRVSKYLGSDLVGIARTHPAMLYASGARYQENEGGALGTSTALNVAHNEKDNREDEVKDMTPEELAERYPYVIFSTTAWDYKTLQAHRHIIGDASYHTSGMRAALANKALEGYIRELGYTAIRGATIPQTVALASGIGELGRNGMLINGRYGARIHGPDTILTDLPLVADKPVDNGVEDFCKVCRKCAVTCPTNSLSFEDKVVYNGIKKYKTNWITCYKLRPFVHEFWTSCLSCIAICPFTKPDSWWRRTAGFVLRTTPIPARPPVVRGLKWLDDRIWGTERKSRVRFMGYDTGIKPGDKACTIAGCTATHESNAPTQAANGKIGYYAPLKENTERFVKRSKA